MLDEAPQDSYEARQVYRRTLDIELEAPAMIPDDDQSVSEYVRFRREREREAPQALAQQRRQEEALTDVTF